MVLVATYGLQLWYLQGARLKRTIKQLSAVQHLVALWITGCFWTTLTGGTEALVGLLPMHILLKRLAECSCTPMATLAHSHPVRTVLELSLVGSAPAVPLGLGSLSLAVKCQLISPAKDAVVRCVEFMEMFQVLHPEAELDNRVVDLFPDRLVRHLTPKMSDDQYGNYIKQLDVALLAAKGKGDMNCVHTASDASALSKGALKVSLAALAFRGGTKITHT